MKKKCQKKKKKKKSGCNIYRYMFDKRKHVFCLYIPSSTYAVLVIFITNYNIVLITSVKYNSNI